MTTGTWVNVGTLRIGTLAACGPVLQDAILAGEDCEFIGMLAWLNVAGCQALFGGGNKPQELCDHPEIRAHIARALAQWNSEQSGSSTRIMRILILSEAPSIDANEITDKGYINQRLTLERRRADVERLFAAIPNDDVIVI